MAGPTPASSVRPTVVVSVGTDHHRFDRLVRWMDAWADANPAIEVIVQRGSAAPTTTADSQPLIPHGELCGLFAEADVVITHGGPSTVMDARAAGRLPIVVARDPRHGEHVDAHQLVFAEHLDRHDLAIVVGDVGDLDAAIRRAIDEPERHVVAVDDAPPPGITTFGRVVDELLGATTSIGAGAVAANVPRLGRDGPHRPAAS